MAQKIETQCELPLFVLCGPIRLADPGA